MTPENKKQKRILHEPDFELVAKIVLVLTLIGIVVSTGLIFSPPIGGEEYAELGLLTYNEASGTYEADNYPINTVYNQTLGYSNNITLYVYVSNHYKEVKFFEIRLKIGLQSVIINEDTYGTNATTYFYTEHWLERILDSGKKWGPSEETKFEFNFTSEILTKLGTSSKGYKIIFELWEWSNQQNDFSYTGIHVYLTSFMVIMVT